MPALVHILQQSQNTAVRQLAAVEARKLTPKMWNDSFAPQIRGTILDSTLAEQDPKTRHASARLISAIAKVDMKDGKWPELTYFCQHASTSQRASDREVGLFVIYSLLESEPDFFENKMLPVIGGMISKSEAYRYLPASIQAFHSREELTSMMENAGLRDVRVHVGPQAAAIGAVAFTRGANVYFAPGQYDPSTSRGRHRPLKSGMRRSVNN